MKTGIGARNGTHREDRTTGKTSGLATSEPILDAASTESKRIGMRL